MSIAAAGRVDFDPYSAEIHVDPYPTYRRLRRHAPVHHNPERGLWSLSRYDDVRAVTRDWSTFSYAQGVDIDDMGKVMGSGNFLDADPPRHTALRRVVRHAFLPKHVRERMGPVVRREVERLVDGVVTQGGADMAGDVTWVLPISVVSEFLGLPPEDHARLRAWSADFVVREPGNPRLPPGAVAAGDAVERYLAELVEERRRHPRGDLVSEVANAQVDGSPIGDAAIGIVHLLFVASFETTAGLLANGLLQLALHPEQRDWLARHPEGLPAAVEEMVRFDSPVQNLKRTTTRPVVLHGVDIPEGASVVLLYGSANRDETRFERGDEFDVRRTPVRHLGFGDGIHHCIGAPLARLEAQVMLEVVLRRMPRYRLAGPPVRLHNHATRGLSSLPVEV